MPEQGPVLATSVDARYIKVKSFVGQCVAPGDVVITNEIKTGEATCPVTGGTISLEYGVCQENICGFHS